MMKKLVLFLALIPLFACSKTDEASPGYDLNRFFEFLVFNSQDVDILDPATPDHYKEEDIKLFYEVDREIFEVYNSNMSSSGNFSIYKHENEYRIKVFLNDSNTSGKSITHIQWNNTDTDTIEATFERTDHYCVVSKVWLNELEIWDQSMVDHQYFKFIK